MQVSGAVQSFRAASFPEPVCVGNRMDNTGLSTGGLIAPGLQDAVGAMGGLREAEIGETGAGEGVA